MSRWRRWLRRLVLFAILLAVVAAGAWMAGRERLTDWLARRAESALAAALHQPVEIEAPRLSLLPPSFSIGVATVGEGGAAARVRDLSARLDLGGSVRQMRPSVAVDAARVFLDLPHFSAVPASAVPASEESPQVGAPAPPLPPFAVALSLSAIELRVDAQYSVRTGAVAASAQASPLRGLALNLRGADVAVADGDRQVALDTVDVAARWRDGTWVVEHGQLRGPALRVDVAGEAEPLHHRVDIEGDLGALSELLPEQWRGDGALTAKLDFVGDLADPGGDASLRITDAKWRGLHSAAIEAALGRDEQRVTLRNLDIALGEGTLSLRGELREEKDLPVHAVVTAKDLDLEVFEPLVGDLERAAARLNGSVEVQGGARSLRGTARGQGSLLPRSGREVDWSLDLDAASEAKVLRATAKQAEGGELSADLRVADGALGGRVRAVLPDVGPVTELLARVAPAAALPRSGRLGIDANLAGTMTSPVVDAVADGSDLVLDGGNIEGLNAVVRIDKRSLEVQHAHLSLPGGSVEASGVFALAGDVDNDWRASASGVDAEWVLDILADVEVLPALPISGRATALVRASGPWEGVSIGGEAAIARGEIAGEPVRDTRATFDARGDTWHVEASAAGAGDAHLTAHVAGEREGLQIAATGAGWQLDKLASLKGYGLAGVAGLDADFSGPPGRLSGDASLRVEGLSAEGTPLGPVDAVVSARDGAWELNGHAFAGAARVHATIDATADLPVRVDATWQDIDAARLLGFPRDLSAVVSGSLVAGGPLRRPTEITGDIDVSRLHLVHGGEKMTAQAPIALHLAHGSIDIQPFALAGKETQVRGHGHVSRNGDLDVALSGEGSLGWLEAFVGPPLESADGDLRFDLKLHRPAGGALATSGEIRLSHGELDFGEVAALNEIEAAIALADGTIRVDSLTAGFGGGRLVVSGRVDLNAGPDLEWRLVDVALEPLRSLEVEVRGSGRLRGPWNGVVLGGEIDVLQLLYDRDLEFTDLIPSFNRALQPPPKNDQGRPPLLLDLRIRAADSLYVENNIARIEGAADLRLTGKLRAPKIKGDVSIVDGSIQLRGRQFDIVNGSLSFRPTLGNVAAIDFKAESVIDTQDESYGVAVRVSGFTNNYRVSLSSSDGSLTATDIASLIAFGKTVSQLQSGGESGGGAGVSLDTLVNLAGNNFAGRLAGRAEEVLPFDQIEFHTQFSTTTGQFEPEVRVGKSLSEDLSAWIGQTFGVQSRTTLDVEYRLSPSISSALLWESSTASEQGAFGGEIRFRRDFWRIGRILFFGGDD